MDQWRSHIPSNNLPKQFCEWSFEQGDRKSQQNELELVLELDCDFFWEEEVCRCRNKWRGATMGPRGRGRAQGGGRALEPRGQVLGPPVVFSVPKILKYSIKIILNLQGIWRTFIFGIFFYCTDNTENRQIILFLLYLF